MIDVKAMIAEMQEREIPPTIMSQIADALDKVVVVGESDPLARRPPVYPTYACDFRAKMDCAHRVGFGSPGKKGKSNEINK